MTLADTNVLLDILARDPVWFDWSIEAMVRLGAAGPLLINEVVYSEMSARLEAQSQVEEALVAASIGRPSAQALSRSAFLAAAAKAKLGG